MVIPTLPLTNPARPARLTVVIVEDERDVREGLAILIDSTPGFRCASCYRTMEQALARLDAGASEQIGAAGFVGGADAGDDVRRKQRSDIGRRLVQEGLHMNSRSHHSPACL